jgi:hypothetical protein
MVSFEGEVERNARSPHSLIHVIREPGDSCLVRYNDIKESKRYAIIPHIYMHFCHAQYEVERLIGQETPALHNF